MSENGDKPGAVPLNACPAAITDYPEVTLAHGAGGALTRRLIDEIFAPLFQNELLDLMHDGAVFDTPAPRIAFTTDSYVVKPLFFPGGDIGSLAVYGTVNDLAMCGARPLHLSLALIIEEGFPMEALWRVARSIATACQKTGLGVVTGDTKVVDRGKGDGVYINATGVGAAPAGRTIDASAIRPNDAIILSGDIGRHGVAVLSARENLDFESDLESDCAPIHEAVTALIEAGVDVHCLRDLTRGGFATALIELARQSGLDMKIRESMVAISPAVRGFCEVVGLDPLYIANEGRFVAFVPAEEAERSLEILRRCDVSRESAIVGVVKERGAGIVACETTLGQLRPLDLPTGEMLPRIC